MTAYTDSLRGYSFEVHLRDGFRCRYCGLEGTRSLDAWLSLSRDHLLPNGHPRREEPEFIVTSCGFCNTADNRFFDLAEERGLRFDGMTQDQLVEQRRPYVEATRRKYEEFWEQNVRREIPDEVVAASSKPFSGTHEGLVKVLASPPAGPAKRWTGNDENARCHHSPVDLANSPLSVHLSWRAKRNVRSKEIGWFELDLHGLLDGGFVRRENDKQVRLRFFHDRDGFIYIQRKLHQPRIKVGRFP